MPTLFKAISIKQPWANLIVHGKKNIETRVWATSYRGRILLVSSKSPNIEPAGYALAVADLVDCRPMEKFDEDAAQCSVYAGAFSWILRNIQAIEPVSVKGRLGLYDISLDKLSIVD